MTDSGSAAPGKRASFTICAAFVVSLCLPASSHAHDSKRGREEIVPKITLAELGRATDVLVVRTTKIEYPALFVCYAKLKVEAVTRGQRFKMGQSVWVTTRCETGEVVTGDRPVSPVHVYSGVPAVGRTGTLYFVALESGDTKPFFRDGVPANLPPAHDPK